MAKRHLITKAEVAQLERSMTAAKEEIRALRAEKDALNLECEKYLTNIEERQRVLTVVVARAEKAEKQVAAFRAALHAAWKSECEALVGGWPPNAAAEVYERLKGIIADQARDESGGRLMRVAEAVREHCSQVAQKFVNAVIEDEDDRDDAVDAMDIRIDAIDLELIIRVTR